MLKLAPTDEREGSIKVCLFLVWIFTLIQHMSTELPTTEERVEFALGTGTAGLP